MPRIYRSLFAVAVLAAVPLAVRAQDAPTDAATVNGQPILKAMVDRATEKVPAEKRDAARKEILDYLIENAVVDQYLVALKIAVDEKEVDTRLDEIKKELVKNGQTLDETLKKLGLNMPEFHTQITADLRWEKFANQQATEAALKALFQKNPDHFDGSLVRARHILLETPDAAAQAKAMEQIAEFRKQIDTKVAAAMAKLPADADALARDQEKLRKTEEAFAEIAKEKSACPSKRDGGDLNFFPRSGVMVEPFALAAFALKPGEMSAPIKTQSGIHLILCTARKTGQSVMFENVKEEVKEVYCNKLREAVIAQERPKAKIVLVK